MVESLDKLKRYICKELRRTGTHGFEHTLRVYNLCMHIGGKLGADLSVLLPAALLHDIAREEKDHAFVGALKAELILEEYGFSRKNTSKIINAIASHSYTGEVKPEGLEAKILSDADRLDAMGAIGVFRASTYSLENDRSLEDTINHFHQKLLNLKELLYTEEARVLAGSRHKFLLVFLDQLDRELSLVT